MKKILTILLLMVIALAPCAQTFNGEWVMHASFSSANIQGIVDTPSKVYFLVSDNLFCYDKSNASVWRMTPNNGLHDITPTLLSYDAATDVLAVAYNNSNIDFVHPDGTIVNFPDIKNLVLTSSTKKGINDINFANGKVYIATTFGYVVVDEATLSHVESHILYTSISSVAIVGSRVVMSVSTSVYYGDASKEYDVLSQMSRLSSVVAGKILPAGDNAFVLAGTAKVYRVDMEQTDDTYTLTPTLLVEGLTIDYMQATPTGFIINCKTNKCFYTLNATGNNLTKVTSTGEMFSQATSTIWTLGAKGIYPRGTTNYIKPNALGISNRAWWMAYNPNEDKLYVSRTTDNAILSVDYSGKVEIYSFDGDNWADVTPVTTTGAVVGGAGGDYGMTFIPSQPCTYFIGTRGGTGTHKIVNGVLKQTLTAANTDGAFTRRGAMALDSQGNLFAALGAKADTYSVAAISAENLIKETIAADDVVKDATPPIMSAGFKRMAFAIGNGDTKVATGGDYNDPVLIWNSNADLTTNQSASFPSFVDQDNVTYSWNYIYDMSTDLDGNVWMGSTQGVIYMDPSQAFDNSFRVNRLKSYDENGGEAGYLLDGVQVNVTATDGEGRHWIGTSDQGVTVVSRDCKQVLRQFNITNSLLPSNRIYSMCYHPTRNSMFVMTPSGLAEFVIDRAPASENYDNTYVFPNPVRPDFTGLIEIKKLMRDSRLTIVNAAGVTVAALVADGGKALWDGCDSNGNRLPTGVYTVLAAPDDNTAPVEVAQVRIIK